MPKGPVLGPMMISAVLDSSENTAYSDMGCKDSKVLSILKREELYTKIKNTALEIHSIEITAKEIDKLRKIMSLNEVEAKKIAELILSFEHDFDEVIVDCPDTEPSNFVRRLHKYLDPKTKIIAEHKADSTYPIVSAASIIAKVERDDKIKKMKKKYGEIGSGYPSDPNTKKFLAQYFEENHKLPVETRLSWETAKRFFEKENQKTLGDY